MLRFKPDSLAEGLLRPLAMADPQGYVYLEFVAPDWRPAALVLLLVIGGLSGRLVKTLQAPQVRLLAAFALVFYSWTFLIGNGRYFLSWLAILGPLVVLASRGLPGSATFRWALLGTFVVVQLGISRQSFLGDTWGLAKWEDGPALAIAESDLRREPAVFITITGISYSLLVPRFHPEARWANVVGQRDMTPDLKEYPSLVELLASGRPIHVLAPALMPDKPVAGPSPALETLMAESLAPLGLSLEGRPCEWLASPLARGSNPNPDESQATHTPGFWSCRLRYSEASRLESLASAASASHLDDVFAAVEARCPRLFPAGTANTRVRQGTASRHYSGTDFRLVITPDGKVAVRGLRMLNSLAVGEADSVRRGQFSLNCDKPPGRYRPSWNGD